MAYQEVVTRAILAGKQYEELPARLQNALSPSDWKNRVKEHCTQRGLLWGTSLVSSVCSEQEYYEELAKLYRTWMRLFPYHLGDYLCRVMRVSPFKYYCEMVLALMREEKSYASLPNFTAADILRVLGIGRNQYISIMNACKGSRNAIWRGVGLGGKLGVSRELLPAEPLSVRMEGWWHVMVVNLGECQ
ncbi:MAG: hypothetical protein WDW36_009687 [Sanguina aurantia]